MRDEGISNIYVVKRDYTLLGMISAEQAKKAVDEGRNSITDIIVEDVPRVKNDELLSGVISALAEWPVALPVVDDDQKLQGVIVKGAVLSALAE